MVRSLMERLRTAVNILESIETSPPDQLVLVVHGVGDPPPGSTVSLFARSLADQNEPLVERDATIWLEEKSADPNRVKTFPAHRRRLFLDNRHVELCEVFWGDLSRVRRGWLGVLQGLFQILFGLRYVAYVAADQPGKAAFWLKTLGLMSSRILHGPVAAVTCFLGLLIVAVCGTHVFWQDSHKAWLWTQILILGCSGVALIASEVGSNLTRSRVVERFWFWMTVTTAFVTGVSLLRLFWLDYYFPAAATESQVHPGLLWYCRMLLVLLGMLWFIEIQVIVAMAVCWALAIFNPRTHKPSLHVGFLLPALAVGIWGQMIPMFWLAAKESIGALAKLEKFSKVFDDAIPFLGVQLVMMALLTITLVYVIASYARWRAKDPEVAFANGKKAPRLIVHGYLQSMLAVCTALGVVLVSSLWIASYVESYQVDQVVAESANVEQPEAESWLKRSMAEANGYAIAVLVPLGGLLFFALPHLRPGFDMILDVVNHFYFRPTNVEDVLDDDDEFDMSETTFENGTLFFSRRDRLHGRMKRILSYYRDRYHHQPELLIICHSQGTMVAIETLNDKDLVWLNNSFRRIVLATMGSPFHHLYQHYFGLCYPPLDQPFWSSLRRRLDRWVNIFRVDDYVGNDIDFPLTLTGPVEENVDRSEVDADGNWKSLDDPFLKAPQTATQTFVKSMEFENHPVGARGHVYYWSDQAVLDLLCRRAFDFQPARIRDRKAA